jgi:hypothetical protein
MCEWHCSGVDGFSGVEIQEENVKVVSRVAGFDSSEEFLVGNVIIVPWNLMQFQKHLVNAWAIPGHNSVFTLLINFRVFRNLSDVKTIQEFMVNDCQVSMFIMLMKPNEETSQVFSSKYLQNMDSTDELIWQMLNLFYSSSCTSNILAGFDFVNQLLAMIMTFKLCETSKEVKMMSQNLHAMFSGLKSCISFHDKFGVTVLAAVLSSKYVIAIRQFGHHIENTSRSVGQYFSTSDSQLVEVEWMGDKLYWEALHLKLHYGMGNIGLFMVIFTQLLVMGVHNSVGAFISSITCRLLGAGLGASLGWGIMIHDGIGLKFITSLCVVVIVSLVVAREWYIAPTLIPTSKQICSYITFAALWRLWCTNSPNILVVMADLMTLMFGFFLRCSHLNMWSLQFHQWDPGGCFFVCDKGDFDSNLFARKTLIYAVSLFELMKVKDTTFDMGGVEKVDVVLLLGVYFISKHITYDDRSTNSVMGKFHSMSIPSKNLSHFTFSELSDSTRSCNELELLRSDFEIHGPDMLFGIGVLKLVVDDLGVLDTNQLATKNLKCNSNLINVRLQVAVKDEVLIKIIQLRKAREMWLIKFLLSIIASLVPTLLLQHPMSSLLQP